MYRTQRMIIEELSMIGVHRKGTQTYRYEVRKELVFYYGRWLYPESTQSEIFKKCCYANDIFHFVLNDIVLTVELSRIRMR